MVKFGENISVIHKRVTFDHKEIYEQDVQKSLVIFKISHILLYTCRYE